MFETWWGKLQKLLTNSPQQDERLMQSDVRTCNNHMGIRSVSLTAHHIRDSHKTESKSEWEITEKQAEEAISKWNASAPPTESLFLK